MPTSPDGTIAASHIWKRFRADRRQTRIREEWNALRTRLKGGTHERWRWALSDVGLHAGPGDSVALIGPNGSGKSTLLKILVRVMYPYAGTVSVSGRVGALIEVSAGIHPQLTARENVYLYGSLLGLSRKQVNERFDAIMEFAEVEYAVDRIVKFYSSGMKMRLGFAVAAFLEPDILLVDEVLAVGDASFQQRCLDRMRHVLANGTTLVFVSHDLAAVQATCQRGIWLSNGLVAVEGPIDDVLAEYRRSIEEAAEAVPLVEGPIRVEKVEILGPDGEAPRTHSDLNVTVVIRGQSRQTGAIVLGISDGPATPIFSARRKVDFVDGEIELTCLFRHLPLPRGRFYLWLAAFGVSAVRRPGQRGGDQLIPWHPVGHFDVIGPSLDHLPTAVVRLAPVHLETEWVVETL